MSLAASKGSRSYSIGAGVCVPTDKIQPALAGNPRPVEHVESSHKPRGSPTLPQEQVFERSQFLHTFAPTVHRWVGRIPFMRPATLRALVRLFVSLTCMPFEEGCHTLLEFTRGFPNALPCTRPEGLTLRALCFIVFTRSHFIVNLFLNVVNNDHSAHPGP